MDQIEKVPTVFRTFEGRRRAIAQFLTESGAMAFVTELESEGQSGLSVALAKRSPKRTGRFGRTYGVRQVKK